MRLDYALYTLAAVFFVLAIIFAISLTGTDQTIWVVASSLLGILSLSLGFVKRPKSVEEINKPNPVMPMPAPQPTEAATLETAKESPKETPTETRKEEELSSPVIQAAETPVIQEPKITQEPGISAMQPIILQQKPEPPANTVSSQEFNEPLMALTEVNGIGEKRASQLKAVGINNVNDLATASAVDLAKTLKISPKIVAKWVDSAKQLQQK